MIRGSWEGKTSRRKFVRISQNELQQKLESILEILQITKSGGLAHSAAPIQEARNTKPQIKRRKYV